MKIYKIKSQEQNSAGGGLQPMVPAVGSEVYIGIDLHRTTWVIAVVANGVVIFSCSMPGRWEVLENVLARYTGTCRVQCVYEAGYFGYWLHDRIVAIGAGCIVTPPSLIPQESGNRVKTDRIDARKLAVLLSKGLLKAVHVPSVEQRAHRDLVRRRVQLVEDRVRVQLRIKAFLCHYGVPFPEIKGRWSEVFIEHLHQLRLDNRWLQASFQALVEEFDTLSGQITAQTTLIHALAATDQYRDSVRLVRTIPGIGLLIAMELLTELYDMQRFPSGAHLAAYVGLTPSQHSSGEHIRLGRITRMGKSHLRAMLVEACWILIGKDALLRAKYETLKHRAGPKRAIVAIARKLLVRVRRVVLDRTPYVPGKAG